MDVQLNTASIKSLKTKPDNGKNVEETAMAFEKLFARQLVQEMTKGLFKQDDNKPLMSAGNNMYREHIVDTLAKQLAEQRQLGMADMITRYLKQKNGQ